MVYMEQPSRAARAMPLSAVLPSSILGMKNVAATPVRHPICQTYPAPVSEETDGPASVLADAQGHRPRLDRGLGVHTDEYGYISQSPPPEYYIYSYYYVREAAVRVLARINPINSAERVAPVLVELLGCKSRECEGDSTFFADIYPRDYMADIRRFGEPVRTALTAATVHPAPEV